MAWQLKMPPFHSKLRTIWLRSRLISQKMSKLENPLKANLLKPRFKISWKKCFFKRKTDLISSSLLWQPGYRQSKLNAGFHDAG